MSRPMLAILILIVLSTLGFMVAPVYFWGIRPTIDDLRHVPSWTVAAWLANACVVVGLAHLAIWLENRENRRKALAFA